jgi:transposase
MIKQSAIPAAAWPFCWTELGAKHVGIIQFLIVICRLHGVDPYTYLVDVLQLSQTLAAADVGSRGAHRGVPAEHVRTAGAVCAAN